MFITFEGLDGSGKTTIIEEFVSYFCKNYGHIPLLITREPGGKGIKEAERIREIILDNESKLSPKTEALLYSASRRIHLERVIWPSLKENKLVLCDRYVDSFYAYQGYARALGIDFSTQLTNLIIDGCMPDLTIFFDITPEESKKRRQATRLVQDRMDDETEVFHNEVYRGYKKIIESEPNRFIIVDATRDIQEVLNELVNKLLNNKKFKEFLDQYA